MIHDDNDLETHFERIVAQFERDWHHRCARDWREYLPAEPCLRKRLEKELPEIETEFRKSFADETPPALEHRLEHDSLHAADVQSEVVRIDDERLPNAFRFLFDADFSVPVRKFSGGLGDVWVVRDQRLGRIVVIKQLQSRWAGNARAEYAFDQEVRITSLLEHPCIPPVHAVGRSSDGRPCYCMRFVEGETLQDASQRWHANEKPDYEELRRLLTHFVNVCRTVAYAHSQGVIHRDLKPSNIIVGPYGETILLDWGLAKRINASMTNEDVQEDANDGPQDPIASLESQKDFCRTEFGDVIGTPAYMSPEQAMGQVNAISYATDVFGLGAILYQLLVGRPPNAKQSSEATLSCARTGDHYFPRTSAKNPMGFGLLVVCKKAMAVRPQDRYSSAMQLADDVQHWLNGEDASIVRQPFFHRATRLAARRTTLAGWGAAMTVATLIAAGIGIWQVQEERGRRALAAQSAMANEVTAKRISNYLADLFRKAEPLGLESPGPLTTSQDARDLLRQIVDSGYDLLNASLSEHPEHLHELLLALGSSYRGIALYDRAEQLLAEAYSIRKAMYGSLDTRTLEAQLQLARLANDRGDYGVAESGFREIIKRLSTASQTEALLCADAKYHLAWLLFNQPLAIREPQHDEKIVEESKRLFIEVIEIRRKWLEPNDPLIGLAYVGFADACLSHRSMMAEGHLAESLAEEVFAKNSATTGLGNVLIDYQKAERFRLNGDYEAAEKAYHQLTEVFEQQVGCEHPVYIMHLWNLAGLHRSFGALEKAEATITTIRSLVRDVPAVRSSPKHLDGMRQYIEALVVVRPKDVDEVLKETIAWASERPEIHQDLLKHLKAIATRDAKSHLPTTDNPQ